MASQILTHLSEAESDRRLALLFTKLLSFCAKRFYPKIVFLCFAILNSLKHADLHFLTIYDLS